MGFNQVYKSLQDLFPQIDARVLKAVAIEHSKDVDTAVVAVVEEIIPFFAERSIPSSPLTVSSVGGATEEIQTDDNVDSGSGQSLHDADIVHMYLLHDVYDENHDTESKVSEPTLLEQIQESNIELSADVYSHCEPVVLVDKSGFSTRQIEVSGVHEAEGTDSEDKCTESCVKTSSENILTSLTLENLQNVDVGVHESLNLNQSNDDFDSRLENDFGLDTNQKTDQGKSSADGENSGDGLASVAIHGQKSCTLDSSVQFVALPEMQGSILENVDLSFSSDDASKSDNNRKVVGAEYESDETLSQSRQIHIIDGLEEIIADARNNKETLFSTMESVINLMKEVEDKEEAAELAKEEVTMGGIDILDKVEELNKMLQHAKAANDMHAGEVYGEKAILATELRELQSRVLSLSDERDKSLAVLNEMRKTLEVRLAEAENEIKCAERKKLEKEKCARESLAEQELIMEKVVQESNILKQQAEDNTKLQEFLLDRGRVVDILQGEIAVICQDVRLLKEKFDERVPFSKSVSSSQTSCILASSTSSMKSMIPEQMDPVPDEVGSLETQKKDPISSSDDNVSEEKAFKDEDENVREDKASKDDRKDPISSSDDNVSEEKASKDEDENVREDKASKDDRKALLDDGWDFFDNHDLEA